MWIALGSICLTLNYYFLINQTPNYNVLGFVFFSTLFTYNFQRILKIKLKINLYGDRFDWISNHNIVVNTVIVLSLLSSIYFGIQLINKVWLLFLFSSFISFFYVWKVPLLKGKNLRDLPGIKIYLIAFVWVVICVLMPFTLNENTDYKFIGTLAISLFLFMVAITVPFDIRDVELDESTKKTIPQLIGISKSVYLSIGLLILSQLILQTLIPFNFGIWVFTILSAFVLYQSKNKQPELYYSGVIDGLLILQIGLLYLFS